MQKCKEKTATSELPSAHKKIMARNAEGIKKAGRDIYSAGLCAFPRERKLYS
jgi:hypothetical protein